MFDKNECAILAYNNKFFSLDPLHNNEITATADNVAKLQTFTLERIGDHEAALKASNGQYLSVDKKVLQLCAKSTSIAGEEKFALIIK
jgi:hypothetical protein